MNIVLVAEQGAGLQALRAIAESEHRLSLVLSSPPERSKSAALWHVSQQLGYDIRPANLVKTPEFALELQRRSVDVIINVHSLYIVHPQVLAAARVGAFNLHPGPLPRYAGLNAVSWAIYRGENRFGVTLHWMSPEIDAGPIVFQSLFPIGPDDTALTLSYACWREGLLLLRRLLDALSAGSVPSIPQDLSQREYLGGKVPNEGRIDWLWPARNIYNFVRACDFHPFPSPWGHPQGTWRGAEIQVLRASLTGLSRSISPGIVGRVDESGAYVACGDEWLRLQNIAVCGRCVDAAAVLKSGDSLFASAFLLG